jgi:Ser/Thr protein kinase RdoA (MazF antagonist)
MGRATGLTGDPPRQVLAAYPAVVQSATIVPLGNHGGFSGARLWRLDTLADSFCLRAGASTETPSHLQQRHALILRARAAGPVFVPAVISTSNGSTIVEHAQRCWEMMEWLPGTADFHASPSPARLRAASSALAQLHIAWEGLAAATGIPPAVGRRLAAAQAVIPMSAASRSRHPLLEPLRVRTRQALARWLPEVPRMLGEWESFRCSLQPCLRDVWHDHLLYQGDVLTGLVDYAGIGIDSVATDLARMLGSLIEDDDDRWREALDAYRARRRFSEEEERLAHALDRTGVIAGLCKWLRWLDQQDTVASSTGAVGRLEELLGRVEKWSGPHQL